MRARKHRRAVPPGPTVASASLTSVKALLILWLSLLSVNSSDDGWATVRGGPSVQLCQTQNGTYALRPDTAIAGTVLLASTQPDVDWCAESCDAQPGCTAIHFCNSEGGCLADPTGAVIPMGACQLMVPTPSALSRPGQPPLEALPLEASVLQLASGNPKFGISGLKLVQGDPGPVEGYEQFAAHSLLQLDDLHCNGTLAAGRCILRVTVQEARDRCDELPKCQGFVYGPGGSSSSQPVAVFKGCLAGTPVDMCKSSLAAAAVAYVKKAQLVPLNSTAPADTSSGMSGGTIAGIVVGAVTCAAVAVVVGLLWWRKARSHSYTTAPGSKPSSSDSPRGHELSEMCNSDSAFVIPPHREEQQQQQQQQQQQPRDREQENMERGVPPGGMRRDESSHDTEGRLSSQGMERGASSRLEQGASLKLTPGTSLSSGGSDLGLGADIDLFSDMPSPQWEDVVVPKEAVQLCRDSQGKPVRLGGGASGDVFRAVLNGNTVCACKIYKFAGSMEGSTSLKRFVREAGMLWRLSTHPNIVRFIGMSVSEGQGMLLMELMQGDLGSQMHAEAPGGRGRMYGWYNRGRRVALEVAVGLAFLHQHRCVHLDLKPRNILLTRTGRAKIADVGFSRLMQKEKQHLSLDLDGQIGTLNWCAPEVLLGHSATPKCDIYSFGILLWELCTGQMPSRGSLYPLVSPKDCPPEVAAIQQRCLSQDPLLRPTAAEVVRVLQSCQTSPPTPAANPAGAATPATAGSAAAHKPPAKHAMLRSVSLPQSNMPSPLQYAELLLGQAGAAAPGGAGSGAGAGASGSGSVAAGSAQPRAAAAAASSSGSAGSAFAVTGQRSLPAPQQQSGAGRPPLAPTSSMQLLGNSAHSGSGSPFGAASPFASLPPGVQWSASSQSSRPPSRLASPMNMSLSDGNLLTMTSRLLDGFPSSTSSALPPPPTPQ